MVLRLKALCLLLHESLARKSSYPLIVASREFDVSLLGANQVEVTRRFAVKGADKGSVETEPGETLAVPLIAHALAHVECSTSQIFINGDYAIVTGLVEPARAREGDPLLYYARRYGTFVPVPEV